MTTAREVRKTVTILFCDLVHSTGLAQGDPEAYRRVQTSFFDRMREIVERHGGTVEKFIGDEVMAVFGIPSVHEDDALRAVRAAQEMQEALPELGLEARIGINTGEVLAGDPEQGLGLVAGEPVIMAKRLEQGASAGEIIIGKATYPLIKHAVSAGPLERISVKGKEEGVGRRRVEEVDLAAPGLARRHDLPLVGREEELRVLSAAFERAAGGGECWLFTVLGAAGIGKSRLGAEFCTGLGDRATTAQGRCLPYGEGITFSALAEIVRDLGGEEGLRRDLGESEEAQRIADVVLGTIGAVETTATSDETFWAVRRAFELLAAKRPLVLCFEDIHWAEPTLLDLIEYLVGWSRGAPIFVLCLARPELVEQRPTWIAPRANADAIALEGLSSEEMEALLDRLRGEHDLSADVRARIADTAEGNPLFVEQIAAMAAERRNGDELAVPPSIQALLGERLDRLSAPERAVIERASVIGRDFPAAAVIELCPEAEREAAGRHLLALVRKQLMRPDTPRGAREDRYRFQHVLVQEAAYDSIPKRVRADLHERVALWAEQAALGPELDEVVGYHLERAYRYREEIGPLDEEAREVGRRAGELLGRAGRRAFARDDMPAAIKLLDRALAIVTAEEPAYPALLHELSAALFAVGEVARSEALLRGVLEAAEATGDRRLEWTALLEQAARGVYSGGTGGRDKLLEVAYDAIAVFEELDDQLGLAKAWRRVASCHEDACRYHAAEEASERALAYARQAGSTSEEARIIDRLCTNLLFGPASAEQAIARCESFLAEPASRLVEANVVVPLGALRAMVGDFDAARRLYARGEAIFDELGLTIPRAGMTCIGGTLELVAGDPEAAERHLRRGYDTFVELGFTSVLPFQGGLLVEAIRRQGRIEEAARLARELGDPSPEDKLGGILVSTARGHAEAHAGRTAEAVALMREAVTMAGQTDAPTFHGDACLALAEALADAGDANGASAAADEAVRLYEAKGNQVAAARARGFPAGDAQTV